MPHESGLTSVLQGPGPTLDSDIPPVPTRDNDRTPVLDESQLVQESRSSHVSTPSTPGRLRSPSPYTGRNRSQTESLAIRRKSSLRKSKEDTVEVAIRELNTIVEERRISAMTRVRNETGPEPHSPTHIPAVAPNMKLRARSETLNDIGSAFRIPVSTKSIQKTPVEAEPSPGIRQMWSGRVAPPEPLPPSTTSSTTALPIMSTATHTPTMVPVTVLPQQPVPAALKENTTLARISTWLKRSASPSAAISSPSFSSPFYQLSPPPTTTPSHRRSGSTVSSISDSSMTSFTADSRGGWSPPPNPPHSRTATIASTVATSILSPDEPLPPRPSSSSISKNGLAVRERSIRRVKPKRGLSIETTASAKGVPPPPPYQRVDPLTPVSPVSGEVSPATPGQVGVAF